MGDAMPLHLWQHAHRPLGPDRRLTLFEHPQDRDSRHLSRNSKILGPTQRPCGVQMLTSNKTPAPLLACHRSWLRPGTGATQPALISRAVDCRIISPATMFEH
jgi:hypothetical protein